MVSPLFEEWTVRFLLLLPLASTVILGFESCGTHGYVLLYQIRVSSNLGDQVPCIYILQEQGGPFISSGIGFPFYRFLRLVGLQCSYSNHSTNSHLLVFFIPCLYGPHRKHCFLLYAAVEVGACLFAKRLFSNDYRIFAYSAVVA